MTSGLSASRLTAEMRRRQSLSRATISVALRLLRIANTLPQRLVLAVEIWYTEV